MDRKRLYTRRGAAPVGRALTDDPTQKGETPKEDGKLASELETWCRLLDATPELGPHRLAIQIECLSAGVKSGLWSLSVPEALPVGPQEMIADLLDAVRSEGDLRELPSEAVLKAIYILNEMALKGDSERLLELARPDLNADPVVRDSFVHDQLRLTDRHSWVLEDGMLNERVLLFNHVLLPMSSEGALGEDPRVFLALKRLQLDSLIGGSPLSAARIWGAVLDPEGSTALALDEPIVIGPTEGSRLSPRLFAERNPDRVAVALAIHHPNLLHDIALESSTAESFVAALKGMVHLVPVYLMVTRLGYPMGGGESFMHQSAKILSELGFNCTWLSFADAQRGDYRSGTVSRTPYYTDLRVTGGVDAGVVAQVVRDQAPALIHSQGEVNSLVAKVAGEARVPSLIGFHFWTGLVQLGPTGNRSILDNLRWHALGEPLPKSEISTSYVVSEFMNDVYKRLGGTSDLEVFHPTPDPAHYLVTREDSSGDAVVQFNVAPGKGGEVFLELADALGDSHAFVGVQAEPLPSDFEARLQSVAQRKRLVQLSGYRSARSLYEHAKLIIIPTQVDETFCRVAFEAAANGIPVLATPAGNIPYVLGPSAGYLPFTDANEWIEQVAKLMTDEGARRQLAREQREYLQSHFGSIPQAFIKSALGLVKKSPQKRVGLFSVWADQGLGIQVRQYARQLRAAGFEVHVFSFLPYGSMGRNDLGQADASDWSVPEHADSVYYSSNTRETVSAGEVSQFVRSRNVGQLIYPEICWDPNWRLIESISLPNLFTFGVPNLEIVRRSEIERHNRLTRTLCPTRAVESILYAGGARNTRFIGHGLGRRLDDEFVRTKVERVGSRDGLRFLHVGGHNPTTRKQSPTVIREFVNALKVRNDIFLTVTLMNAAGMALPMHPNIRYVTRPLSHRDVQRLYDETDVSIQISSHEGLGMGFYESVSRATPVISLDLPPHNEVVLPGQTGWLLPCTLLDLEDNDDAVVRGGRLIEGALTALLLDLSQDSVAEMIEATAKTHALRFDEHGLLIRLLRGMW